MLARDYILRLLTEFTEAIENLLNEKRKGKMPDYELKLQSLYTSYFNHNPSFYYTQDAAYILNELRQNYEDNEFLIRIEMLTELLYQDAICKQYDEQRYLLAKTLFLLEYLDKHSDTFSLERKHRIKEIKSFLRD